MRTSDFDYPLPERLIAQTPVEPRDHSRLLVLHRDTGAIEHRRFYEIGDYLRRGDLLVFNDSRVIPARLFGRRPGTGGKVELLLLRRMPDGAWEALAKPGRRVQPGARVRLGGEDGAPSVEAEVVGVGEGGVRTVRFSDESALDRLGVVPLPPYIRAPLADPERYQTVYARVKGSAAAPTAGLHFTPDLLRRLQEQGVEFAFVTLHIGLDTFRPVTEVDPRQHKLHLEHCEVPDATAEALTRARREGRRIVAVGTTAVRALETVGSPSAEGDGVVPPYAGETDTFILPGHRFRLVDVMLTNFHLPRSSLLMLVAAFAGTERVLAAYREAAAREYRFYSFGDAMLIV